MDLSWLAELLPFDRRELSPEARAGLGAARAMQNLRGNEFGPAIRELADSYSRDPSTIRRWISKAQLELTRAERHCEECGHPLPRGSRSSRRYCDQHASTAARVHRHRSPNKTHRNRPLVSDELGRRISEECDVSNPSASSRSSAWRGVAVV